MTIPDKLSSIKAWISVKTLQYLMGMQT